MSEEIEILSIKRIDQDRRVAHVRVGEITIRSLWIVGLAGNKPRTSWPETSKGYPIVEADAGLKARIDKLVFEYAGIEPPFSSEVPFEMQAARRQCKKHRR